MEHWIFDRKISENHLAKFNTAGNPVFFKTENQTKYKNAGIFGDRLSKHLDLSVPEVSIPYEDYRTKRKFSTILDVLACISLGAWVYQSDKTYRYSEGFRPEQHFFKGRNLPFLFGAVGLTIGGSALTIKGEKSLRKAVLEHNKRLK